MSEPERIKCMRCDVLSEPSKASDIVCEKCYKSAKEQGLIFQHNSRMEASISTLADFIAYVEDNRINPMDQFGGDN